MNNIKSFEDFVNEGLFDFLKSDTIDFTKPDKEEKPKGKLFRTKGTKEKDESGFWKRPKNEKPDITPAPQRPYYGVQEEEEEEAPYKKVVRRSDDYWSDDNVRLREARKRKTTTARK